MKDVVVITLQTMMKEGRAQAPNMKPAEETQGQNFMQITVLRLVTQPINLNDGVYQSLQFYTAFEMKHLRMINV